MIKGLTGITAVVNRTLCTQRSLESNNGYIIARAVAVGRTKHDGSLNIS